MSTDGKDTACPSEKEVNFELKKDEVVDRCDDEICEKKRKKPVRKVCFPDDDHIVTQYFEPADPWHGVSCTNRAQLAAEYLESCRRHNTPPIESVLRQIRELPENCLGGGARAPRLTLGSCLLQGVAPVDALEAVLKKTQFRRLEIDQAHIDDEAAEALFDMVEYYESATAVALIGPRAFGIRGWQAASRMIKKSCQLSELEVSAAGVETAHAPVLARALSAHACRLRSLALQHARLAGDPLLALVIALKSNNSVRELRLGDNGLTAEDAAQLASLLRYNTRLQLLDLSNNSIQDAGCGHICEALAEQAARCPPPASPPHLPLGSEARGLAYLVLWNNQLTRNCAPHISKALVSQSLCVVNVGRNAVGGEVVAAIATAAAEAAGGALVSLGLQAARLGPQAARALHLLISHAVRLQRLDLRDNKLGGAALAAILSALERNTALSQIDLDDPAEKWQQQDQDAARLTLEIRARCGDNEPPAPPPPLAGARKISLTIHSPPAPTVPPSLRPAHAPSEADRRGARLRSPLPSPAGSPVPPASRFSVTRVTPEREPSSPGASLSPASPTASRFKVVQVAEPPQIHVSEPRRNSRFSVTRNYDAMYEPSPSPPPPTPASPAPDTFIPPPINITPPKDITTPPKIFTPPKDFSLPSKDDAVPPKVSETPKVTHSECETNKNCLASDKSDKINKNEVFKDKTEEISHSECIDVEHGEKVVKTETKLVKNTTEACDNSKINVEVQVKVKTESKPPKQDDNVEIKNTINETNRNVKDDPMKQIEAITEDLGNLIQEMKDFSVKTKKVVDDAKIDVASNVVRDNVVLKKNKSESSLDSPDLEVSRLMTKKLEGSPFCDSSSSLEISGSSMESLADPHLPTKPLIIQETVVSDTELDRRKPDRVVFSTESSLESNTSELLPVSAGNFLNMSVSSNESVSPIMFGRTQKIHDSLSSLEASVSSLDSKEKVMITSADSGIEYSLQHPTENKEETSSNEGTLTNNSSLRETCKKTESFQDTLTSPKRTASLLDVPALKSKGLERMRKISWVAPSSSFQITKPEPQPEKAEQKTVLPSHLDKLLSLFQHPTSLFSRNTVEDDRKCSSSIPPRKDSSLTSSFWSWGGTSEKEREDRDSSEATDTTLSERNQVSFVDESFSKKLDSKTPSTDTENTLSEFQSFPTQGNSEASDTSQTEKDDIVTDGTTDQLVQKSLVVSVNIDEASSDGNKNPRASDSTDLMKPNDLNKNYPALDSKEKDLREDKDTARPRSFAAVLKASGSENSLDKQTSPEAQPVNNLPSKVIRGIKENISPENTLTKSLALELAERQLKSQPINKLWDTTNVQDKEDKAPIATIEETCDEVFNPAGYTDDLKFIDERNVSADSGVTSLEGVEDKRDPIVREAESVDLGKDALSYLIYENQLKVDYPVPQQSSLAQELIDAENKDKLIDLSPELVIDEAVEAPEVFVAKENKGLRTSPVIPDRAKLKKSNSLEELSQTDDSPKTKTIAFKIPETNTSPRDIPERRQKLRSRSGSSPKSLPESLNKPCPLTKDTFKKKKKVSSLGKMAKDSLLALNMTEEEIAEFRRSYKLTSVESLKSLESVSEDANSQSGASAESRCRSCLRTSQESLLSLDSMTDDCKCTDECEKTDRLARSVR